MFRIGWFVTTKEASNGPAWNLTAPDAQVVDPDWEPVIRERSDSASSLTHQLFRFPAKTHPPAAREIVERYSESGDTIADPFVGSGTIPLEALVAGRHVVASDVDPLSVFVTKAKVTPLEPTHLSIALARLEQDLQEFRRSRSELIALQHDDISEAELDAAARDLFVPAIPNINHWFRRHVLVDLARMHRALSANYLTGDQRRFFLACFASAIRLSSNADPVPVSGLEVTSYMLQREARGRIVDPFAVFSRRARSAVTGMEQYWEAVSRPVEARILTRDGTNLPRNYPKFDTLVTSPPYHGAVDYYRRHTLEMYWLGLTRSHQQRLTLKRRYLGRDRVGQSERLVKYAIDGPSVLRLEATMRESNEKRANAFHHYCAGMRRFFATASRSLKPGRWLVLIVGHGTWNGSELDTSGLLEELASPLFKLSEAGAYSVVNRHMSYTRHNGANIDREWVLAFRRSEGG